MVFFWFFSATVLVLWSSGLVVTDLTVTGGEKKKKNRRSRTWRISGPLAAVSRSGYAKPPNEFTQIVALSLGLGRADCGRKKVDELLTLRFFSKRRPEQRRR